MIKLRILDGDIQKEAFGRGGLDGAGKYININILFTRYRMISEP